MADLLTTKQVAERLNVSHESVRRWAEAGALPHIVLPSGKRRFRRVDIDAILEPVGQQGGAA